jgi:hypothetical protein
MQEPQLAGLIPAVNVRLLHEYLAAYLVAHRAYVPELRAHFLTGTEMRILTHCLREFWGEPTRWAQPLSVRLPWTKQFAFLAHTKQ